MRRAVCPGSYDPVTKGHLDIVRRAAGLFDEVIVAAGVNVSKSRFFSPEERLGMLETATADLPNVRVAGFTGLLTDFCRDNEVHAIVKGLRGSGDFEYELPMAQMNAHLADVETVFIAADPAYSFVSSSLVKEVASFGGDVGAFVPDFVLDRLTERAAERTRGA